MLVITLVNFKSPENGTMGVIDIHQERMANNNLFRTVVFWAFENRYTLIIFSNIKLIK